MPRSISHGGPTRLARSGQRPKLIFDETGELIDGYRRVDNITEDALTLFKESLGAAVTKDDIFH